MEAQPNPGASGLGGAPWYAWGTSGWESARGAWRAAMTPMVTEPAQAALAVLSRCANHALTQQINHAYVAATYARDYARDAAAIAATIETALEEAKLKHISGKDVTPFLLGRIVSATEGRSLKANVALVENNARLGAQIAKALSKKEGNRL